MLKVGPALSPLITLEMAQQERSLLLLDDKRLLREGSDVDLLCNQKGNYESLKLILIMLKCMCICVCVCLLVLRAGEAVSNTRGYQTLLDVTPPLGA